MSDKFSLYQTDGLWGIIENASNEKQTSIKSYFGSDLIIKRLNEQADQIDQLKQQLEEKDEQIKKRVMVYEKQFIEQTDEIYSLKQQLAEKEKKIEFIKHLGNHKTTTEMFKENAKLIIEKRQLAIQELEKVKVNLKDRISMMNNEEHSYLQKVVSWYDICEQVNKQIKELKGEKDNG